MHCQFLLSSTFFILERKYETDNEWLYWSIYGHAIEFHNNLLGRNLPNWLATERWRKKKMDEKKKSHKSCMSSIFSCLSLSLYFHSNDLPQQTWALCGVIFFFLLQMKQIIGVNKLNDWYPVDLVIEMLRLLLFHLCNQMTWSFGLYRLTKHGLYIYLFFCVMCFQILCISGSTNTKTSFIISAISRTWCAHYSINCWWQKCVDLVLIDRKYDFIANLRQNWKKNYKKKK